MKLDAVHPKKERGGFMDHSEYIRIAENSKNAVLMIHGIAGTPAHFRDVLPAIPEDWSVYNILLDGHGGTVADFGATSMERWKAQVRNILSQLLVRYERIVIVAHSMGTLFAIQAAIDHPGQVNALFLQAVPLYVHLPPSTMLASLRVALRKTGRHPTAAAMAADSSIQMDPRLYRYISWMPRMMELLQEIKRVRSILPQLAVPCEAYQSKKDELVSARSEKALAENPFVRLTVLEHSGHFAYSVEDAALLRERLCKILMEDK